MKILLIASVLALATADVSHLPNQGYQYQTPPTSYGVPQASVTGQTLPHTQTPVGFSAKVDLTSFKSAGQSHNVPQVQLLQYTQPATSSLQKVASLSTSGLPQFAQSQQVSSEGSFNFAQQAQPASAQAYSFGQNGGQPQQVSSEGSYNFGQGQQFLSGIQSFGQQAQPASIQSSYNFGQNGGQAQQVSSEGIQSFGQAGGVGQSESSSTFGQGQQVVHIGSSFGQSGAPIQSQPISSEGSYNFGQGQQVIQSQQIPSEGSYNFGQSSEGSLSGVGQTQGSYNFGQGQQLVQPQQIASEGSYNFGQGQQVSSEGSYNFGQQTSSDYSAGQTVSKTSGGSINDAFGVVTDAAASGEEQKSEVSKHLYFFAAPEDEEEEEVQAKIELPQQAPKKTFKIIFIKAPSYRRNQVITIPAPPVNDEKTLVYVLVKKPEGQAKVRFQDAAPTQPTKPEVFFIKYKTQKEAEAAVAEIQSQHGAGGQVIAQLPAGSQTPFKPDHIVRVSGDVPNYGLDSRIAEGASSQDDSSQFQVSQVSSTAAPQEEKEESSGAEYSSQVTGVENEEEVKKDEVEEEKKEEVQEENKEEVQEEKKEEEQQENNIEQRFGSQPAPLYGPPSSL